MTRTAYHRPIDHPTPQDCEPLSCVLAKHLAPGDVIRMSGCIDLLVIDTRTIAGFTVADYDCTAGSGSRTYASDAIVTIKNRVVSEVY